MSGTGNTATQSITLTGDVNIDSVISGLAWTGSIDYSFPATNGEYGSNYQDNAQNQSFLAVSSAQQTAFYFALDADIGPAVQSVFSVEGFTNLDVSLTTAINANIRAAESADANPTAYAYQPATGFSAAGDVWFGPEQDYRSPVMGDYSWHTHIHEIGHALGLDHTHEGNIGPATTDHVAYSVMSYVSYEGGSQGYSYGAFDAPQTFMQIDIAALQHMYGADYTANSGNTTYTWTPGNSDTVINGVIALDPGGDTIFATLWDGGGTDTYDLSAYATNMRIDLSAGGYSRFDTAQLASLGFQGQTADGNIYNALMFQGNQASLIENAIGGTGNDLFVGNEADNVLDAGAGINSISYEADTAGVTVDLSAQTGTGTQAGADTLIGFSNAYGGAGDDTLSGTSGVNELVGGLGADILIGGAGADVLTGGLLNYVASLPSALGMGSGSYNRAANTNNTSAANAVDLTNLFSLTADADIENATTIPHVSVSATGDTAEAVHYYAVTLNITGTKLILDIDYGSLANPALGTDMDSWIQIYDPNGNLVATGDDSAITDGAGGSVEALDSFVSYTTTVVGTYTIAVGTYDGLSNIPAGATYELQVSVEEGIPSLDDMSSDILEGGAGDDVLNGNLGIDYARYTGGTFADYTITNNGAGSYTVVAFGNQGTDTLTNIEFLRIDGVDYAIDGSGPVAPVFTEGNDTVNGTPDDDIMDGLGGSDIIYGLGGADIIAGGSGNDDLFGGDGDDILTGGIGADDLDGGNDTDTASYADSNAGVTVHLNSGITIGGHAAGDTLVNIENTTGSQFRDVLTGTSGVNILTGNGGNDTLSSFGGDDFIYGGAGRDFILGGPGADFIDGGADSDTARYKGSNEGVTINLFDGTASGGHALGDTLISIENLAGSSFDDTFTGNDENNTFYGSGGSDTLDGGAGTDVVRYTDSSVGVSVDLRDGVGTAGDADGDTYTNIENIYGSFHDDVLLRGDAGDNLINGDAGADKLYGFNGDDTLFGGAGGDLLHGGFGSDFARYSGSDTGVTVNLATGAASGGYAQGDSFVSIENLFGSRFADTLTGDDQDNRLFGEFGADTLSGGLGNDVLYGGSGGDMLIGGGGNDTARYDSSVEGVNIDLAAGTASGGHADGDVLTDIEDLFGTNTSDVLRGDSGDNKLFGSGGADTLSGGGGGTDSLFGGGGADIFEFSSGDNYVFVRDFQDDVDTIDLSSYGYATIADALANMSQAGNHVRFFEGADTMLILNTDLRVLNDDIDIGA